MSRNALRVLVAGGSWIRHTIHMKGFDQFHTWGTTSAGAAAS
jgi:uncharacterized membrane protein